MNKQETRSLARQRLALSDPGDRAAWSAAVCTRLVEFADEQWGGLVMLFSPLPGEVDVRPLVEVRLAEGLQTALPRADWGFQSMQAVVVNDLTNDLAPSRHGLSQPRDDLPAVPPGSVGLIVVPGLAFDEGARRVGRGAGFYDRFLARWRREIGPQGRSVGAAFELQVFARVPADEHDVPLDAAVTERRIIRPPH